MIGKSDESSKAVPVATALYLLENRKKLGELGYEQQVAEEHAKKVAYLSKDKAEKMVAEITALGVPEKVAVKVVDIMPINEVQLRQDLVIAKKPIEDETIKSIMSILGANRGK